MIIDRNPPYSSLVLQRAYPFVYRGVSVQLFLCTYLYSYYDQIIIGCTKGHELHYPLSLHSGKIFYCSDGHEWATNQFCAISSWTVSEALNFWYTCVSHIVNWSKDREKIKPFNRFFDFDYGLFSSIDLDLDP